MNDINLKNITQYHEETKHSQFQYAKSPGYMDWENQPNPFRRYEGVPLISLPFIDTADDINYSDLFNRDGKRLHEFTFKNIGAFLELSMGISAWKEYQGVSWALRINPSSGNLHPTETNLILPPLAETGNQPGIFHYTPYYHALELRADVDQNIWESIEGHFKSKGFLVGLSTIFWRESWKYGERAFRYCNHDVGHAMACLSLSANLRGWKVKYLNTLSDDELDTIFGFDKTIYEEFEEELPDNLFYVYPGTVEDVPRTLPSEIISTFKELTFKGKPDLLSKEHVNWNIINEASVLARKPETEEMVYSYSKYDTSFKTNCSQSAECIIRKRRSAQAYDGKTSITREQFFSILDKTVARNHTAPFDLELNECFVHLLLFVHRVTGLDSGLYFFVRNESDLVELKSKCHSDFLWERVNAKLPLYLLKRGDYQIKAQMVSCQQEIAGDGAFSLSMIAKFRENVEKAPYLYRHLFWETGMIGQILYLEAEANSIRGTGIGCFFDDVHELTGLNGNFYQSLYHFTVGGQIDDERLTTLQPYHHLTSTDKAQ